MHDPGTTTTHATAPGVVGEPPRSGRIESVEERADRNLAELMQELRVALPGVQVLFAFLLAVPFTQRFAETSEFEQRVYFVTLMCAAFASVLLIGPTMYHRLDFGQGDKPHIVVIAHRLSLLGLSVLAIGMLCAILLITHVLFGETEAIVATGFAGAVFFVVWYGLPLRRRVHLIRASRRQ